MAPKTSDISKVGNNYYQTAVTANTDGSLSATTFRTNAKGEGAVAVSTASVDKNGKTTRTYASGATDAEKKALVNPNSPERQAYSQQVLSTKPYGDNPTAEQKQTLNDAAGKSNTATNTEKEDNQNATEEQKKGANEENESFKEGTRTKYSDVYYPLDLSLKDQDCIKFSILEYKPSLSTATGEQTEFGRSKVDAKNILGNITLPIPSSVTDSNTVSWQSDTLNLLEEAGAQVGTALMQKGMQGAEDAVKSTSEKLSGAAKAGEIQTGLAGLFGGMAVGKNSIQQRAFGSIFNNNLELLFNGPALRSFSFAFKLSPRTADEAKAVMTIIRYFKQAMSVKRSQTTLLLKTPRTFAISYLTSNKEHPYLNKFKECALTGFNVNYTPEGQYMTYMSSNINERSMISYEISLSFEELEPVFDDEYGNESTITSIGY